MRLALLGLCTTALVTLAACASDDDDTASQCASFEEVSGSPSFADQVVPIFQLSCNFSSCHSSESINPQAGLALGPPNASELDQTTIDAVHDAIVGKAAAGANELLIAPGEPAQSFLLLKLVYQVDEFAACGMDCVDCGARMPNGSPPLSQDRIDTIAAWIASGAAND